MDKEEMGRGKGIIENRKREGKRKDAEGGIIELGLGLGGGFMPLWCTSLSKKEKERQRERT